MSKKDYKKETAGDISSYFLHSRVAFSYIYECKYSDSEQELAICTAFYQNPTPRIRSMACEKSERELLFIQFLKK